MYTVEELINWSRRRGKERAVSEKGTVTLVVMGIIKSKQESL